MKLKICSQCKIEKELFQFSFHKTTKDGLYGQCRECRNKNNRKYEKNNKELIIINKKHYYQDNKKIINEKNKQYRINNKEKLQQYYKDNKEYKQLYRLNNKERIKEQRSKYYKDNNIKLHQYIYRQNHQEIYRNYQRKRRALKKNQIGYVPYNIKQILIDIQNYQCHYCQLNLNENKYHLDHWIPLSKGGLHDIYNLQLLCISCNLKKYNKLNYNQLPPLLLELYMSYLDL